MGLDVLLVVLSLMGWLGNSLHTPICGADDLRVIRGSIPYETMIDKWGRDAECDNDISL